MRNLKFKIFTIIIAVLGFSCENDGGTSVIELDRGAVPNMVKAAGGETIIDLVRLNNGENIALAFSADIAQGNPASIDIVGVLTTLAGPVYTGTLFSNVSLPEDFTVTISDVVASISEINSASDISLGDVLTITTRFTMADGTVLNIVDPDGTSGTGTNLQTTVLFTTVINYPVSCPTSLEGNYTSTVISSNLNIAANFRSPQPVTITQPAAGTYILSDGTADIFGPDFPIGLTFTDVCGTITVATASVQFPGVVDFMEIGAGASLDQTTGIITLPLEYTAGSCCGLPGIQWTLELTPN
jgi:hypothetical protein